MALDDYFVGIDRRQRMMLLSALTFGGQQSLSAFDYLPEGEAEVVRLCALRILEIPRKKRVSLMLREMKRLITTARGGQPWAADPDRLARLLRRERPALIEVALRLLPAETAHAVRSRLSLEAQSTRGIREVKQEILEIVRWKLEEALVRGTSPTAPVREKTAVLRPPRSPGLPETPVKRMGGRGSNGRSS